MSTLTYEKLRAIRNSKDVSAREMADILGLVTEAAYYKKETGAIRFTVEEAKLVANKLQMPIDEIFFADDVSSEDTEINDRAPTGTDS